MSDVSSRSSSPLVTIKEEKAATKAGGRGAGGKAGTRAGSTAAAAAASTPGSGSRGKKRPRNLLGKTTEPVLASWAREEGNGKWSPTSSPTGADMLGIKLEAGTEQPRPAQEAVFGGRKLKMVGAQSPSTRVSPLSASVLSAAAQQPLSFGPGGRIGKVQAISPSQSPESSLRNSPALLGASSVVSSSSASASFSASSSFTTAFPVSSTAVYSTVSASAPSAFECKTLMGFPDSTTGSASSAGESLDDPMSVSSSAFNAPLHHQQKEGSPQQQPQQQPQELSEEEMEVGAPAALARVRSSASPRLGRSGSPCPTDFRPTVSETSGGGSGKGAKGAKGNAKGAKGNAKGKGKEGAKAEPELESKDGKPVKHRVSCHRCGNKRAKNVQCTECPHIFCRNCTDKMCSELGVESFWDGCPVCKELCCCGPNRTVDCNRKYHCRKKCIKELNGTPVTDAARRVSCHRCGNVRKSKMSCNECPQVFCKPCHGKLEEEMGKDIFEAGCPVCKEMCCCGPNQNVDCERKYHCSKRCLKILKRNGIQRKGPAPSAAALSKKRKLAATKAKAAAAAAAAAHQRGGGRASVAAGHNKWSRRKLTGSVDLGGGGETSFLDDASNMLAEMDEMTSEMCAPFPGGGGKGGKGVSSSIPMNVPAPSMRRSSPYGGLTTLSASASGTPTATAQPMLIVKPADGKIHHLGDPVRKGAVGLQGGLSPFTMSMGGLAPLGMGGGLTPYIGEYTPITAGGSPIKPDYFAN